VYEDSLELQQVFMKTRDELCKNGEILLTPALSFTETHLQKALEKERKNRTSKEREIKEDEDKKEAAPKSEDDSEDSLEFGSDVYTIGDYVYIEPREKGQDPHIVCIEEFDRSNPEEPQLKGCWFLRPNETYHLATRKFLQKEVFKSDFYDMVPLSKVLGKCFVMTVREYFKLKPVVRNFELTSSYQALVSIAGIC
jgi:protein polybromo-1